MRHLKELIILGLLTGFLFPAANHAATPEKAADFSLKDLSGKTVRLSDFRGKVVLLNFWATWCGPCKREMPDLVKVHESYRKKGAVVVGIALDDQGAEIVKPFIEKNKINFPVLIGDFDVVKAYGGFNSIPTSFVINRKGEIVKTLTGMQTKEVFESSIKAYLR